MGDRALPRGDALRVATGVCQRAPEQHPGLGQRERVAERLEGPDRLLRDRDHLSCADLRIRDQPRVRDVNECASRRAVLLEGGRGLDRAIKEGLRLRVPSGLVEGHAELDLELHALARVGRRRARARVRAGSDDGVVVAADRCAAAGRGEEAGGALAQRSGLARRARRARCR